MRDSSMKQGKLFSSEERKKTLQRFKKTFYFINK